MTRMQLTVTGGEVRKIKVMASEKKKRKLKNSYCGYWALKNVKMKMKRVLFYTSSQRKKNNNIKIKDKEYD